MNKEVRKIVGAIKLTKPKQVKNIRITRVYKNERITRNDYLEIFDKNGIHVHLFAQYCNPHNFANNIIECDIIINDAVISSNKPLILKIA